MKGRGLGVAFARYDAARGIAAGRSLDPLRRPVPQGGGDPDQTKRRALAIGDLAYNAAVDRERMAARPARAATVTYKIGQGALTPAAMWLFIKRTAVAAVDQGLVDLMGAELVETVNALSTHSLRVGLTQDLFANGEDAGPIAQALRWTSTATALRYGGPHPMRLPACSKGSGSDARAGNSVGAK